MKILYCILPLLISVASPSFTQKSIFTLDTNQFNRHQQVQYKPQRRRKPHRGSGRRNFYKINKVRNS